MEVSRINRVGPLWKYRPSHPQMSLVLRGDDVYKQAVLVGNNWTNPHNLQRMRSRNGVYETYQQVDPAGNYWSGPANVLEDWCE